MFMFSTLAMNLLRPRTARDIYCDEPLGSYSSSIIVLDTFWRFHHSLMNAYDYECTFVLKGGKSMIATRSFITPTGSSLT